jgi:hypothetical protein
LSGGRFWVLEPDEGKPSSPVLRGLGASNGARLLDNLGTGTHARLRRYQVFVAKFGFAEEIELGSGLRKDSEAR